MVYETMALSLGVVIVSAAISYALWIKVRVLVLRNRLFGIRDNLFDYAMKKGKLDDPAYRETRQVFNSFILLAGTLSLSTVAYLRSAGPGPLQRPRSECDELQEEIERAIGAAKNALWKYIMQDTLSGICVRILVAILPSQREGRVEGALSKYREISNPDGVGRAMDSELTGRLDKGLIARI